MESERDVERMEQRVEELEERIDEAREDWERKRADPSVPGAPARSPEEAGGGAIAGDWEGEGSAANEARQ